MGKKLSDVLESILSDCSEAETLGEVFTKLEESGIAIILIIFSVPAALPIPAAGYSTLLSIPLLAIGVSLIQNKNRVFLPKKMEEKEFKINNIKKLVSPIKKLALFLEKFSKPRLSGLVSSKEGKAFIGICCIIMALFMAIPIPGTNTLPAGAIFLFGFSMLERDGLFMLAATIYSIVATSVIFLIFTLGYEEAKALIKSFV